MSGTRITSLGRRVKLVGSPRVRGGWVCPRWRVGLVSLAVLLLRTLAALGQQPSASPQGGMPTTPLTNALNQPGAVPSGPGGVDGNIGDASGAPPAGSDGTSGQPTGSPNTNGLPTTEWLVYPRSPACCGPIGGNGPIGMELYLRSGVVIPMGGGILEHWLQNGWDIDGGARALFFSVDRQSACTVSLGVSNIFNAARGNNPLVTLKNVKGVVTLPTGSANSSQLQQAKTALQQSGLPSKVVDQIIAQITPAATTSLNVVFPTENVSVADYNQTYFNLAGGNLWYLLGSGDCGQQQCNWRVGYEVGGRYGTSKADMNQIRHLTDTVGGMFGALYTDIEVPCRCGILQAGFRAEYQYIWGDILQAQNPSDFQSWNILGAIGLRF